jgi:hypothetical protein
MESSDDLSIASAWLIEGNAAGADVRELTNATIPHQIFKVAFGLDGCNFTCIASVPCR